METVNRLSIADYIIVFDSSGHICEQGTFEQLRSSGRDLRATLSNTEDESSPPAPASVITQTALASASASKDTRRQEGDWRVYRFYGESMGWFRLVLFGICIICCGTFAGLQSKYPSCVLPALADQAQQLYGLVNGLSQEMELPD